MANQNVKVTEIESRDYLRCLIRGDVVKFVFHYEPRHHGELEALAAFHENHKGQLEFLVPAEQLNWGDYLLMYSVDEKSIKISNGKVILNEDKSAQMSVAPSGAAYPVLNQTLILSGLRSATTC